MKKRKMVSCCVDLSLESSFHFSLHFISRNLIFSNIFVFDTKFIRKPNFTWLMTVAYVSNIYLLRLVSLIFFKETLTKWKRAKRYARKFQSLCHTCALTGDGLRNICKQHHFNCNLSLTLKATV